MPFGRIVEQTPAEYTRLRERLLAEWRHPTEEENAPIIIKENDPIRPQQFPQHLYVIWNDWIYLSQQDRSRIILAVYEEVEGQAAVRQVTVAMGLTREEADGLRIHYEAVSTPA